MPYRFTVTDTQTGRVLRAYSVVGGKRELLAAMLQRNAPSHVFEWVRVNTDSRRLKWYDGPRTVRVVKQ